MCYILINELLNLARDDATQSVITLLVSFGAFVLYRKQRKDQERDAAGIILREVESAELQLPLIEKSIEDAKASRIFTRVKALQNDSWDSMQNVLARRLPADVMRDLGNFYGACRRLDISLEVIDNAFWQNANEIRANLFRVYADNYYELIGNIDPNPLKKDDIEANNKKLYDQQAQIRDAFANNFPSLTNYTPVRAADDAEIHFKSIPNDLSRTRVGEKLRRAQLGFFSRLLSSLKV